MLPPYPSVRPQLFSDATPRSTTSFYTPASSKSAYATSSTSIGYTTPYELIVDPIPTDYNNRPAGASEENVRDVSCP